MSTLQELLDQKRELNARIEQMRQAERTEAIARIKEIVVTHGLTAEDLGKAFRVQIPPVPTGRKAPILYRDPATQETWSGRGLMPKWLKAKVDAGESKDAYRVAKSA
jgi:DNA-binding protein H-NS